MSRSKIFRMTACSWERARPWCTTPPMAPHPGDTSALAAFEQAVHRFDPEASAARQAALDGRLEVSHDDSYKATYIGSSERYLELSREYRERKPQRRPSKPRTLLERTQPVARPSWRPPNARARSTAPSWWRA